jgi:hypothetical protein
MDPGKPPPEASHPKGHLIGSPRRLRSPVAVGTVALIVTIALLLLSPAYGVTFDEGARQDHGERVLSYLRGELSYRDFRPDGTGRHLYGALFDTCAAWLHERLGGNVWLERHYLGAAFAGFGVLATGFVAFRLAGATVALFAMTLLVFSPRYVGHATNNPKDIPFAALCVVSLLAFTLVRSSPPFLTWRRAFLIGLALALPLNVRPGGLLYVGYFACLLAAMTVRAGAWSRRQLLATTGRLAVVTCVALTAGTVFWPWAQQNPLARPIVALFEASRFKWNGDVLFAGRDIPAQALPWTYAPVWITITTPPVVLCGLVFAAAATVALRRNERLWRAGLWTIALTPIVLAIVRHSTLYDGWRHLLFVYPPLVILAASGWRDCLATLWNRPGLCGAALAALLLGCVEPVVFMVRNHPNEVVYFNALVGGPHGAFKRFELDYWGNSVLQATRWTESAAECTGRRIAVSGWPYQIVLDDVSAFPLLTPTKPDEGIHHLEVQLLRDSRQGLRRTISRRDVVYVVRTYDGAPLAVLLPGPRFAEIQHFHVPDAGGGDGGRQSFCAKVQSAFERVSPQRDLVLNATLRP